MKRKHVRILLIFIGIVLFIIGIIIGKAVRNIPVIELHKDVNVVDLLTLIVTVSIGVVFPFLIKKWMDDNHDIKIHLVDEIEELHSTVIRVHNIIDDSFRKEEFNMENRDSILYAFHKTELQIDSLQEQIDLAFPHKKDLLVKIKDEYRDYNTFITGGELMISSFNKIDLSLYRKHQQQYKDFESILKKSIISVLRI